MVMFPPGHARNTDANLRDVLNHKFQLLGRVALSEADLNQAIERMMNLENLSNPDLLDLYNFNIQSTEVPLDENPLDYKKATTSL